MATLTKRKFQYTSGSGTDKWTYDILVTSSDKYYGTIVNTPLGLADFDSLEIPESVLQDMIDSITALKAEE